MNLLSLSDWRTKKKAVANEIYFYRYVLVLLKNAVINEASWIHFMYYHSFSFLRQTFIFSSFWPCEKIWYFVFVYIYLQICFTVCLWKMICLDSFRYLFKKSLLKVFEFYNTTFCQVSASMNEYISKCTYGKYLTKIKNFMNIINWCTWALSSGTNR